MKKILFLISIIMLTGCSVVYELNIDNNNSYNERINFTESNNYLKKYGENTSETISNIIDFYFSGNEEIEPVIVLDTKNIKGKKSGEYTGFTLNQTFSNQKIYQESLFFNYYFETSKITNAKDTYTIYGNKFNYDNVKKLTTSYKYTFDADNIVIKIQSYYDVIDSNATKIDKKTNTYYWVVNEDNASNFELKLTYSKDKKYTYNEKTEPNVIEKITGNIVEKISFGKVNGTEFVKNNKIIPILLIGIVLTIILVIVFFIKKKIEKTNKLWGDYNWKKSYPY